MPHPGWTVESLAARLPQRLRERVVAEDSDLRPLFEAWIAGWLDLWSQDLTDLETQLDWTTATGNFLRLHNRFYGAKAPDGASDDRLRFHLALELLRRQGAQPPEGVRSAIATALNTDPNQITLVENEDPDTGEYSPAQFYVTFDLSLLEGVGFAPSEFAEAFADIDRTLDHVAGTGIRAFAKTLSESFYDTDEYDSAIYSS